MRRLWLECCLATTSTSRLEVAARHACIDAAGAWTYACTWDVRGNQHAAAGLCCSWAIQTTLPLKFSRPLPVDARSCGCVVSATRYHWLRPNAPLVAPTGPSMLCTPASNFVWAAVLQHDVFGLAKLVWRFAHCFCGVNSNVSLCVRFVVLFSACMHVRKTAHGLRAAALCRAQWRLSI